MNTSIKSLFGIDGCRGGWVIARTNSDLCDLRIEIVPDLRVTFEEAGGDSIVGIDIPIGIPENEARVCDRAARQLLRWPRSSSVFSPPVRAALCANTFVDALRINREATGTGISKQAFHITAKIREVDQLMTSDRQQFIHEAHPEVTFAQLNGGPLMHNKKDSRGRAARIALLQKSGLAVSESSLMQQRMKLRKARVLLDDLIDALACLVTASAILAGKSRRLGRPGQMDSKGLAMEIVTHV